MTATLPVTPVLLSPTQTREPGRTVARTVVQVAVAVFPLLLIAVPEIVRIVLDETGKAGVALPGWLYGALAGTAAACTLFAAVAARVMAIPAVNLLLDRCRLSAGRSDLYEPEPLPEFLPERALDTIAGPAQGEMPAGSRYLDADGNGPDTL